MPSSPTRPTSRPAWPSIGVISEMKLSVGKKTWRIRSPGLQSTSPKAKLDLLAACQQMLTIMARQ